MGSKEPLLDAVKRLSYITARGAANRSFRIENVFLTCAQVDADNVPTENMKSENLYLGLKLKSILNIQCDAILHILLRYYLLYIF